LALPRILIALPLLAAGIFAPGLTAASPLPDRPHVVGMKMTDWDRDNVTLHVGDSLEVINNSNFLHTLAPGANALIKDQAGMPRIGTDSRDLVVMPRGADYQTYTWNTPGTYHLTCTLHNDMTLTVVVLPSGA
jgi:plastocyanin